MRAILRNRTYELVADPGGEAIYFEYSAAVNLRFGLAVANRQLRNEYLPIFYDQVARIEQIQAKVCCFDLKKLTYFLENLPSLHRRGMRRLSVTLVFAKPGATVAKETITRWVEAAQRRRHAGSPVSYEVKVDWRHYAEEDPSPIDDAFKQLSKLAIDENMRVELATISDILVDDMVRREEEELERELEREFDHAWQAQSEAEDEVMWGW